MEKIIGGFGIGRLLALILIAGFLNSCGVSDLPYTNGDELEEDEYVEDEYEYEDEDDDKLIGLHYQGVACMQCHDFGGGTVFKTLNAKDLDLNNAAVYHTVKLLFQDGTYYIASKGRGSGNFKIKLQYIKGSFTAIVLDGNGNEVNRSLELSHTADRYDCNSCHTANGSGGAPGRIVNYYTGGQTGGNQGGGGGGSSGQTVSFSANVYPILQSRCQICHQSGGMAGNTGFIVSDVNGTYSNVLGFINTTNPTQSLLLLKATNSVTHGGGKVIDSNTTEYQTILSWIQQGAPNN